MLSLKAKIWKKMMYKFNNFNRYNTSDPVAKMQKVSAKFANGNYPEYFTRTNEQTPSGTKYERLRKNHARENGRLILYFHGGAYIGTMMNLYREYAEDFYHSCGVPDTVYLDYSLAPEYQYPTQLNEALDLWHDLTERQGYAPEKIILGGDSAGANLLLAMMLKLRDDGEKMPLGAFCISPWADMTGSGGSFSYNYGKDVEFGNPHHPVMTPRKKEYLLKSPIYCFIGEADRKSPYISPVFGEYHNFPPMMFTVGGDEMLLDDTMKIVAKLKAQKIPVLCEVQPEMFHIYAAFRNSCPESQHSWSRILKYIRIMYRIQ